MKVEKATDWERILQDKCSLERLEFRNSGFLEFGDLISILRLSPRLVELRLERCFHISNILLQALADYTPLLENLYLSGCLITEANLELLCQRCRTLKNIDFSCSNMTLKALLILMEYSPWLEELDLSEIQNLGEIPAQIPSLIFPSILTVINLRNTAVNDLLLRHIAVNSPKLQVLILEDCLNISDSGVIKVASHCSDLETLDLSFCSIITDLSLQAFAIQAAKYPSQLKELHLSACELITPATVHQLVKKCGKLELLILDGCEKMKNTLIHELASVKDEISCTMGRLELLHLAKLPIQKSSFGNATNAIKDQNTIHTIGNADPSLLRKNSKSIMASASADVNSTELAFAERSEKIKRSRLSRGSISGRKPPESLEKTYLERIAERGRILSIRSSSYLESAGIDKAQTNLGRRSNSGSFIHIDRIADEGSGSHSIAPTSFRQTLIDTSCDSNVNHISASPPTDSIIIDTEPSSVAPFKYSLSSRGRLLMKIKVEIKKDSLKELLLYEFDEPSGLAKEFCDFHNNPFLADSLTRMLTIRKKKLLQRLMREIEK